MYLINKGKKEINVYNIDSTIAEELLCYHDIYQVELPQIEEEIHKLNMHMAISIISELINAREYKIKVKTCGLELSFPFEVAMKKILLGISADSPASLFSNPVLHKNKRN